MFGIPETRIKLIKCIYKRLIVIILNNLLNTLIRVSVIFHQKKRNNMMKSMLCQEVKIKCDKYL